MEGGRRGEEKEPIEGPSSGEKRGREAYGPLDIERHRKDDGRALILYSIARRGKE